MLQNVVDTYRKENESICAAFEEIERIALNAPKSTKEMIELGEYMLHVKNKRMLQLTVNYILGVIQQLRGQEEGEGHCVLNGVLRGHFLGIKM